MILSRKSENIVMALLLVFAIALLLYGIMTTDFSPLYTGFGDM